MYYKRKQFECIRVVYFLLPMYMELTNKAGISHPCGFIREHQRNLLIKPYELQSLNQKIQITKTYTAVNKTMLLSEGTENSYKMEQETENLKNTYLVGN